MLGRLLAVLVAVGCVLGALAWARSALIQQGRDIQRAEDREANAELQRQAARAGTALADQAQQEAQAARSYATTLQQELADAQSPPLTVPARCPAQRPLLADGQSGQPVWAAAAAAAWPAASTHADAAPAAAAAEQPEAPPDGAGLTAHAVRVWNSALAGHSVPGPACSADGDAAGACAAGLTVDDAWANHIENAARCREDRARHARLIAWLHGVHGTPAQPLPKPLETTP